MPRFHFNVHDGQNIPDADGMVLPGVDAAREQAVIYAGELLRCHGKAFWEGDEWYMEVTDDRGLILFRLMFIAIDAASNRAGR